VSPTPATALLPGSLCELRRKRKNPEAAVPFPVSSQSPRSHRALRSPLLGIVAFPELLLFPTVPGIPVILAGTRSLLGVLLRLLGTRKGKKSGHWHYVGCFGTPLCLLVLVCVGCFVAKLHKKFKYKIKLEEAFDNLMHSRVFFLWLLVTRGNLH